MGYLGDASSLEGVQRRWTTETNEMDHLEYAQTQEVKSLFSLG